MCPGPGPPYRPARGHADDGARGGVICLLVAPDLLVVAWLTDFAIVGS
ncbi:hypothetical protein [Streptomyces niger]|nr:hypothetical protein [Streptomyces niger]